MSYNTSNYGEQGGARTVIGGSLDVASGGDLDIESGGSLKIAGTAITSTAAELNIMDGVTATATEINTLDGITSSVTELNSLDASTYGAIRKYRKAALTIVANTNSQDTAIVLPSKAIITNVWVDVTTAEATGTTKTVDIGISGGDEDGLLAGVSVSSIAVVKGTLLNTGQTLGALMSVDEDGAGTLVPEPYSAGGSTIAYTLGSADFAELVANVIVEYVEIA